jgi:hypothetical protein
MANVTKLKRRNPLGVPPPLEEASQNLTAPEIVTVPEALANKPANALTRSGQGRIDGRSLRKTGRTVQFATKVSPEYDEKFRLIAQRDSLNICVLLEKSLDAYEEARK